ncbi:50S ribosomal protein L2 [bacterium (Candidatus Gribaldobacteria) CG_4_9_14_3_um_filter_36_15]|uniref:Large ribosomal subunit protein uL2 n=4 Tax=Candidatus Gribaldobacteria TaxID=2798536 RepID=A0A2M7VJK6_9BACT|nr:MAG: 50S ribosomal protein L2 [Parcubacteria group bacterium CG2_30_36_21]PIR91310.1 MAG: 50S ribosomal protein L2 [bacterium (Candidatus Gribaldobacteria) CG10_big_fil_rev_8_21_14_0_10_37_46]PIV14096.1 MAG: 50S ribosomal protein L2 [bacterium (Candidatus Gribaldobacteria) CG03_land_8_20_14_0_80_36_40]PJA02035.1 MAG: 50S ribosomal protein L2 [bacterium (Candidatus Gribaldobacteria) CG_4_10_14_0_2_um_filter_36_18]PJB09216.1 MAG: 50S ribosomal protein L2 [bacterium (Candidatus Gribaldobacteria
MKLYKPTTPSRRRMTGTDFSVLTKKKPEKKLLKSLKRKAGRSSNGRITIRHKGGGAKRLYRIIDFGEEKINIPARVIALEYDPFRSAFIALLEYQNKEKRYILSPQGLRIGDEVIISEKTPVSPANRMKLKSVPIGTIVYNVEIEPGRGGKLIKSAGTSAQVLAQEGRYTHLKMPSGEVRKILSECFASIGEVSNPEHRFIRLGKAGRSRWKGIRPTVRGSAMSPVDHPHGGGEGRSPIGLPHPKTPWGKPASGVKTRKKKWTDKLIIQRASVKRKRR